jgi:hypothetical protein
VVVHTCNPSTQENHDFKASLGYIARFYLKKIKIKINTFQNIYLIMDISWFFLKPNKATTQVSPLVMPDEAIPMPP